MKLLAHIPGGTHILHVLEPALTTSAQVLMRGFNGGLEHYQLGKAVDEEEFWSAFGQDTSEGEHSVSQEEYLDQLNQVIHSITQRELHKVVLSRKQFVPGKAHAQKTFEALQRLYSSCTVFALIHPEFGSWMGATPEVLLEEVEGGFRSMSLAGTRLKGGLNWGIKELEEQKFVTKEVHRTLKEFGGRVSRDAQMTLEAGPVEHLLTWVNTDKAELATENVLEALHPTPAVCGSPTEKAREVIAATEGYDRALYTGYLAFTAPKLWAVVMLRTMKWTREGITYFAGGGITKDSVPLSEWMETEHKISALKDAVVFE